MLTITPTQFHFIASFISGVLLVIVGFAVLSRDKQSEINKLFFAFFILMGLYELLTALQVIFLNGLNLFINGGGGPIYMSGTIGADISRALLTTLFIVALACGSAGTLMINYGVNNVFNKRTLTLGGIIVALLVVLSVSHEYTVDPLMMKTMSDMQMMMVMMGGIMSNFVNRDIYGWIGFYLSIIVFTAIIIIELGIRIVQDAGPVKSKMIRLLIGSIMVIGILSLFDVVQVDRTNMDLMVNLFTHAFLHVVTFTGELLILSAFWSPINVKVPSLTKDQQAVPV